MHRTKLSSGTQEDGGFKWLFMVERGMSPKWKSSEKFSSNNIASEQRHRAIVIDYDAWRLGAFDIQSQREVYSTCKIYECIASANRAGKNMVSLKRLRFTIGGLAYFIGRSIFSAISPRNRAMAALTSLRKATSSRSVLFVAVHTKKGEKMKKNAWPAGSRINCTLLGS